MLSEFDMYVIRAGGIVGFAWIGWVTRELIQMGRVLAVIKKNVLNENP